MSSDTKCWKYSRVLLNKRPFYLHGYFFPFLAAYAIAGFVWQEYFGMDHYEIGIILVVSLFLIQILTVLSCFWSVDFRCWITCSKVAYLISSLSTTYDFVTPYLVQGTKYVYFSDVYIEPYDVIISVLLNFQGCWPRCGRTCQSGSYCTQWFHRIGQNTETTDRKQEKENLDWISKGV